ncbi:hypothetical protein EMCRGX_G007494 [Ephydatia muelleri]
MNAHFIHIHANIPAPTHLDPTIAAVTLDIVKLVQTAMTCINTPGSYQCGCTIGYALAANGRSCIDVNECSLNAGLGYCQQKCTNTVGSYYCSCNTGYTQFGYYCNDIDECSSGNGLRPCQQTCTNTIGSYNCGCISGYALQSNGHNCSDIDECSSTSNGLGLCEQICINEPGAFHCDCYEGYVQTDQQHSFLGSSIIAPSIAIPLGLLIIMLLLFITIFVTRRIRKKGSVPRLVMQPLTHRISSTPSTCTLSRATEPHPTFVPRIAFSPNKDLKLSL